MLTASPVGAVAEIDLHLDDTSRATARGLDNGEHVGKDVRGLIRDLGWQLVRALIYAMDRPGEHHTADPAGVANRMPGSVP